MAKGEHLGAFEHLVLLALVRIGGRGYGMQVRRELQHTSGRDVAIGAVYGTLDRLEAKGHASSSLTDPEPTRSGRPRRVYQIEASGTRALRESRTEFDRMWKGVTLGARRGR